LAKEKKELEEAEKQKQTLEEQLNRYSMQYETTQKGSDLSADVSFIFLFIYSFKRSLTKRKVSMV